MSQTLLMTLAAVVVLGVASQWTAWRLRIPAILLLLGMGIAAGPGTEWLARLGLLNERWLDPDAVFGPLLLPLVSLSVALILFEGGLTLNAAAIRGEGSVVWKMVSLGAAISWAVSACAARWILGMDWPLAVLLGAILVVTGPTVIGPLLRHVRPTGKVGPILRWEGIVIDPIGAMLAVIVFEVIAMRGLVATQVAQTVGLTLAAGGGIGLAGAGLLYVVLRRGWAPDYLHSPLTVMLVVAAFAMSNALQHESGLLAVTAMGIAMANQRHVSMRHILEFKEALSVLLIASLFILLGSRLRLEQIASLDWRTLAFLGVLVLAARPLSVLACTAGSTLRWNERLFLCALAPRGIVAAAVASVFALRLRELALPGAEQLVPATFAVIIGTVAVYGLGAPWASRRLGLSRPGAAGFLIVGASAPARALAAAIQREGIEVMLVDTNAANAQAARLAGLSVVQGSAVSASVTEQIELSSIGRLLAMTPSAEVNSLAAMHYGRYFGRGSVHEVVTTGRHGRDPVAHELRGQALFDGQLTYTDFAQRLAAGAVVKSTKLTREFGYDRWRQQHGDTATPLAVVSETGELSIVSSARGPQPRAGQTLIGLVDPAGTPAAPQPAHSGP